MKDGPVRIILETDMESDIDDAATLGMLHALADNGECEILAVMHNTSDRYGAVMIDAINTYYGRPDLPIGVYKKEDAPSAQFGGGADYTRAIATHPDIPKSGVTRASAPAAVALYQEILADQPARSVIILSVGWLTNLRDLHRDALGRRLIDEKVARLVLMGGRWSPPDTDHLATMNLAGNQTVAAAFNAGHYIVEHWPTPIVFSGMEVTEGITTGEGLRDTPVDNPVREAYRYYKKTRAATSWDHHNADQCTALFAVRGSQDMWSVHRDGGARMFLKPNVDPLTMLTSSREVMTRCLQWQTRWDCSLARDHAYLSINADRHRIAAGIEALMIQPPRGRVS
jgi:inosine-uridine nucleoside N-ribohydrolase